MVFFGKIRKKPWFFLDFTCSWPQKPKKHMGFFWILSENPKKPSCFFGFQVLLVSETKKTRGFFWIFTQNPKKNHVFFRFLRPGASKIQKNHGFFWIFPKKTKKTSRKPKNPKKAASRLHGFEFLDFWIFGFVSKFANSAKKKCFLHTILCL